MPPLWCYVDAVCLSYSCYSLHRQERKKLRQQRRREAEREKQEKIQFGLVDKPEPKGTHAHCQKCKDLSETTSKHKRCQVWYIGSCCLKLYWLQMLSLLLPTWDLGIGGGGGGGGGTQLI